MGASELQSPGIELHYDILGSSRPQSVCFTFPSIGGCFVEEGLETLMAATAAADAMPEEPMSPIREWCVVVYRQCFSGCGGQTRFYF